MYRVKILVALETDSCPSSYELASTSLAWYESEWIEDYPSALRFVIALDEQLWRDRSVPLRNVYAASSPRVPENPERSESPDEK